MASDDAMDVESGLLSQGPFMEVDSRQQPMSQAAIDEAISDARQVVLSFLRSRKAEEIVPANSRVVILDAAVQLRYAFRALLENGKYNISAHPLPNLFFFFCTFQSTALFHMDALNL